MAARTKLSCLISDEAHAGWVDFAKSQGPTVTALVEAIGLELASLDENDVPEVWRRLAGIARGVSSDHRRRKNNDDPPEDVGRHNNRARHR